MALRIVADSLADLPEGLREGAKQENGAFVVSTLKDGWAVENVHGLKGAVAKERQAQRELASLAGKLGWRWDAEAGQWSARGIDPDAAQEAIDAVASGKVKSTKDLDDFKAATEKKFADERAKIEAKLAKRTAEARARMVRGDLSPVIAKLGGAESAEAIIALAERFIRVDEDADGNLMTSIVDAAGKPRVTKRSGSSDPMGYEELIAEMREASATRGLFRATATGGSGGNSQPGGSWRADGSVPSARSLLAEGFAQRRAT